MAADPQRRDDQGGEEMSDTQSRRGVLRLIGMAPIAAQVAAKEQALAKINLGRHGLLQPGLAGYASGNANVPGSDHLHKQLKKLLSPGQRDKMRRQMSGPISLDPDLASSRSMSISAAVSIQRERNIDRMIEQELGWLQERIGEMTGGII